MIIDCHCHAGKGEGLQNHWSTNAPIEPYLRRARAAGIDKTVIFAAQHNDYARAKPGWRGSPHATPAALSALPAYMRGATPAASTLW
jgi:hypothetical protein